MVNRNDRAETIPWVRQGRIRPTSLCQRSPTGGSRWKYPGLVDDVNVPVKRADGSDLTDFDIELKNAVIQVKAGPGKGAGGQVTRTQEGTNKPVIVYGPKLRPSIVKEVNSRGGIGVTSLDDLMAVIAP